MASRKSKIPKLYHGEVGNVAKNTEMGGSSLMSNTSEAALQDRAESTISKHDQVKHQHFEVPRVLSSTRMPSPTKLPSKYAELTLRTNQLQEEKVAAEDKILDLEIRSKDLENELTKEKKEKSSLEYQVRDIQASRDQLNSQATDLFGQNERLKSRNEVLTHQVTILEKKNFELMESKADLNLKLENVSSEREDLLKRLDLLSKESTQWKTEYEQAQNQITSMESHVEKLENEIDAASHWIEEAKIQQLAMEQDLVSMDSRRFKSPVDIVPGNGPTTLADELGRDNDMLGSYAGSFGSASRVSSSKDIVTDILVGHPNVSESDALVKSSLRFDTTSNKSMHRDHANSVLATRNEYTTKAQEAETEDVLETLDPNKGGLRKQEVNLSSPEEMEIQGTDASSKGLDISSPATDSRLHNGNTNWRHSLGSEKKSGSLRLKPLPLISIHSRRSRQVEGLEIGHISSGTSFETSKISPETPSSKGSSSDSRLLANDNDSQVVSSWKSWFKPRSIGSRSTSSVGSGEILDKISFLLETLDQMVSNKAPEAHENDTSDEYHDRDDHHLHRSNDNKELKNLMSLDTKILPSIISGEIGHDDSVPASLLIQQDSSPQPDRNRAFQSKSRTTNWSRWILHMLPWSGSPSANLWPGRFSFQTMNTPVRSQENSDSVISEVSPRTLQPARIFQQENGIKILNKTGQNASPSADTYATAKTYQGSSYGKDNLWTIWTWSQILWFIIMMHLLVLGWYHQRTWYGVNLSSKAPSWYIYSHVIAWREESWVGPQYWEILKYELARNWELDQGLLV